jgi:hypothetical protein
MNDYKETEFCMSEEIDEIKYGRKYGKREDPISTQTGFILYSADGRDWKLQYPDEGYRYGGATAEKVAIFFLCLGMGHTLDKADEIAFGSTRLFRRAKK